ncbi:MAG: sigma-70 family RNA polymerase sigma factor [Flavobacteriales bacterium]
MITENVIKGCLKDDRKSQRIVYETYYPLMLAIVRRYIRDDEEVLDVLNQGFIKVFKKIDQYHFENSFEGWCKRIVINTALDHLRSSKRYRDFFAFDAIMPSYQVYNDGLNDMSIDELMSIIDTISPVSKLVFNMFAIDGYSHKEIAEALNISVGTSKWHLSSARKQIQAKIKLAYPDVQFAYG